MKRKPTTLSPSMASSAKPQRGHASWQEGVSLAAQRDWCGAIAAFERATRQAPRDPLYWVNLANAHRRKGANPQALAAASQALSLDSKQTLALQILADCHLQAHRYPEAIAAYSKLEALGVREAESLVNHGSLLLALHRPSEALEKLAEAAMLKPALVQAHAMMAEAFRDMGLKKESVECLKTVLALRPNDLESLSRKCFESRRICDWKELATDTDTLDLILSSMPFGLARRTAVFGMLSLQLDPELLLAAARAESLVSAVEHAPLPRADVVRQADEKIQLAYISYDFREHPVSQLLVEVLEQRDQAQFNLTLYSYGPEDDSEVRRRLKAAVDNFVDLHGMTDRQAAQRIRDDGVEILVDLQGHTRGQRQAILAMRPAPVQVNFLGYPGSTGADFMDYIIGDPFVTPVDLASLYSEKLAQLPLCFQPNGRWRPLPEPMTRQAAGLPDGAFVMCAFNHTYKILPEAFDAWCEVMREEPNAVLWLKESNGQLRDNVYAHARDRGISADRILFARNISFGDHFSRLALADVFVDTWPYNAHTTASDALWAGVPVITVYQNGFASRVAASVLNAVGMGELAFENAQAYKLAIRALARDPELLQGYKSRLQSNRMEFPLFNSRRYSAEIEALYVRMAQRIRAGLRPAHLPA